MKPPLSSKGKSASLWNGICGIFSRNGTFFLRGEPCRNPCGSPPCSTLPSRGLGLPYCSRDRRSRPHRFPRALQTSRSSRNGAFPSATSSKCRYPFPFPIKRRKTSSKKRFPFASRGRSRISLFSESRPSITRTGVSRTICATCLCPTSRKRMGPPFPSPFCYPSKHRLPSSGNQAGFSRREGMPRKGFGR